MKQFKRGDATPSKWANEISRISARNPSLYGFTDADSLAQRLAPVVGRSIQVYSTQFIPQFSVFEITTGATCDEPTLFNVVLSVDSSYAKVLCTNPFSDIQAGGKGHADIISPNEPSKVIADIGLAAPQVLAMCGPIPYALPGAYGYQQGYEPGGSSNVASIRGTGLIALSAPDSNGLIDVVSGHQFMYEGELQQDLLPATNKWTGAKTATAIFWTPDPMSLSFPNHFIRDPASRVFTLVNRDTTLDGVTGDYVVWCRINNEWRVLWAGC